MLHCSRGEKACTLLLTPASHSSCKWVQQNAWSAPSTTETAEAGKTSVEYYKLACRVLFILQSLRQQVSCMPSELLSIAHLCSISVWMLARVTCLRWSCFGRGGWTWSLEGLTNPCHSSIPTTLSVPGTRSSAAGGWHCFPPNNLKGTITWLQFPIREEFVTGTKPVAAATQWAVPLGHHIRSHSRDTLPHSSLALTRAMVGARRINTNKFGFSKFPCWDNFGTWADGVHCNCAYWQIKFNPWSHMFIIFIRKTAKVE